MIIITLLQVNAMHQVDIAEAVQALPDLIKEAMSGEEVVITQENQPLVKLSPIEQPKQQRIQAGSAKGMIWMSDDFDEPLEDFKEYME
jgi:prevent-host-death family protein